MKNQNDTIDNADELKQLKKLLNECKKNSKKLEVLSIKDTLTNLYNRRHFDDVFHREIQRAERDKKILSFAIIDVDNLKKYNDCNGHEEGNNLLKSIAEVLAESIHRGSDFIFRLGGEEFGIIFTDLNEEEALHYIDNIRIKIKNMNISHSFNDNLKIATASFGLVVVDFSKTCINKTGFYSMADHALHDAKQNGRNRVVLYAEESEELEFF
ncbi:MAG: GGDEF domain-containing protein [Campylobacteraceae bacterium]|nr:GGDEF domain-containing protein [Campylobacteraceae bacterium]